MEMQQKYLTGFVRYPKSKASQKDLNILFVTQAEMQQSTSLENSTKKQLEEKIMSVIG